MSYLPPDWTAVPNPTAPPTPLPGATPPGTLPALPGSAPVSSDEKARAAATEALWASLKTAPVTLASLILFVNEHPELVQWAAATKARLSATPGAQP